MPRQKIGDKEYELREESFEIFRQEWAEYVTESGMRVRVKPEVFKIYRAYNDDGKPAFTNQGDPLVLVRNQTLITASERPKAH
jgi:hypothetical protein